MVPCEEKLPWSLDTAEFTAMGEIFMDEESKP